MGPRDFEEILAWLKGAAARAAPAQPRPHQRKALKDILPALDHNDRATAIMACATGKTFVALWTAERMRCRNILVLVPSLALLRQTLHEWLRETRWDKAKLSYLCVCSDPTVKDGTDELVIDKSELEAYKEKYRIISAKIVEGRLLIHVKSDEMPDAAFAAVEPDLEDVYFSNIL